MILRLEDIITKLVVQRYKLQAPFLFVLRIKIEYTLITVKP